MATLLLIDDDSVVLGNLYDLFCDVYECHTADRAEQALEYLEIQRYDVVLTDIAMPGLGGVEILKRIKEQHAKGSEPLTDEHTHHDVGVNDDAQRPHGSGEC